MLKLVLVLLKKIFILIFIFKFSIKLSISSYRMFLSKKDFYTMSISNSSNVYKVLTSINSRQFLSLSIGYIHDKQK